MNKALKYTSLILLIVIPFYTFMSMYTSDAFVVVSPTLCIIMVAAHTLWLRSLKWETLRRGKNVIQFSLVINYLVLLSYLGSLILLLMSFAFAIGLFFFLLVLPLWLFGTVIAYIVNTAAFIVIRVDGQLKVPDISDSMSEV